MVMPFKVQKYVKRVILPLVVLIYLFITFFQFHAKNIYRNGFHQLEPYRGGNFDDVKILRCYKWYHHCNQLIDGVDTEGAELLWHKIDKNLDIYGEPPSFWSFYTDYLYVHLSSRGRFGSQGRAIVDIALGELGSNDPPFYVVNDAQTRITRPKSRLDATFNYNNWELRSHGIWAKYDRANAEEALTNIQYIFGDDVVDPRGNWKLLSGSFQTSAQLTIHRGPLNLKGDIRKKVPILTEKNGEFKIIQISDLHFNSNHGKCKDQITEDPSGCQADRKTLNFLNDVLSRETPDFAVITGDLLENANVQDYQAAVLKALAPLISRSIPFAIAFGENDINNYASRDEIVNFIKELPFAMMDNLDEKDHHNSISGDSTNYALKVFDSKNDRLQNVIYVLDLFKKSTGQSEFLKQFYNDLPEKPKFSLEFQHQPIQEYRPKSAFAIVGNYNEKGRLNIDVDPKLRQTMSDINVNAMSVGFEHTNECCIHGDDKSSGLNALWMCYGGATGEGGYGDTKIQYERRVRFFRINTNLMEITSWKRKQTDPGSVFDYQYIYNN